MSSKPKREKAGTIDRLSPEMMSYRRKSSPYLELEEEKPLLRPKQKRPPQFKERSFPTEWSKAKKNGLKRVCNHCEATVSPMWRTGPDGSMMCNACGIYFKVHGEMRPREMIVAAKKLSPFRKASRKRNHSPRGSKPISYSDELHPEDFDDDIFEETPAKKKWKPKSHKLKARKRGRPKLQKYATQHDNHLENNRVQTAVPTFREALGALSALASQEVSRPLEQTVTPQQEHDFRSFLLPIPTTSPSVSQSSPDAPPPVDSIGKGAYVMPPLIMSESQTSADASPPTRRLATSLVALKRQPISESEFKGIRQASIASSSPPESYRIPLNDPNLQPPGFIDPQSHQAALIHSAQLQHCIMAQQAAVHNVEVQLALKQSQPMDFHPGFPFVPKPSSESVPPETSEKPKEMHHI